MVIKKTDKRQTEEYKSLVKNYFIEQKAKEIGIGVFGFLGLVFIPYLIGLMLPVSWLLTSKASGFTFNGSLFQFWASGFIWVCVVGLVGFIGFIFLYGWIQSNLRKARDRADEKLNIMEDY